jgi:hypothetical protein
MDQKRLRQTRWSVRSRLSEHSVYLAVARLKYGHMVVSDQSELLIDGFTRSGVVFATIAFQLAQQRPVRLAHLLHSPAHVIAGVRLGVPCLVTVRHPRDAVLSAMIREPALSIGQLLAAHDRFYRTLMPYRNRIVVAQFDRVTADLGGLTEELNERFGCRFTPPDLAPELVARAFELIDERAQRPPWEDRIGEFMSGLEPLEHVARSRTPAFRSRPAAVPVEYRAARPSSERRERKRQLLSRYDDPRWREQRHRADATYRRFVDGA